ncbi:hypothetical protein Ahy_B03g061659 isoform A [Arachis hypogaea]|nr:hypothetical protein Ahy_B03g061659 isoform A [Arachis hypogaea]
MNNDHSVQSNVESLENLTSLMQKGRQDRSAESKLSKKPAVHLETSDKTSNVNKKNGTLDIRSSKGKAGSSSAMPEVKGIDAINFSSIKEGKSESLSSSFNKIAVDVRSGISDNTNSKGSHPQVSYKPEKWMLPQQAEDTLTQLNLAIVGHVDSGKSTLSGRLLHLLGRISQKQMHKFEKEAKIQGKGSFAYAWALDESSEERERGITMTVAVAYFDTKKYHVVVLDSPGHKDFVPNMISGATQADAAILVIDASRGSFEAGMDGGKGQTREHAQLIRSFGVDQVIVAVNKMDTVAYAKDRFDYIRQQLGMFLRTCGFKDSCVSWIPMSAMENQNLVASPSDASFKSWYNGPYLLDAIDSLPPPAREYSKPLLMPICDVIKSPTLGQVSACGKLEAGALRSGSKVLVMPAAVMGTVRSMERDSNACSVARAGDNVSVTLQGVDGSNVIAGGVLCHPDFPVAVSNHLELKVLVLDGASPVLMGSQLEFHIHHAKEPARVSRISSILDPKTGKVTKKSPRCLTAKQSAVIEVTLQEPVCVVDVSICKALGRVSLRSSVTTHNLDESNTCYTHEEKGEVQKISKFFYAFWLFSGLIKMLLFPVSVYEVADKIMNNDHSVQSNVESLENLTSLMQKGRQDRSAESKLSKKPAVHLETSDKTSNVNKKNGTLDIRSSKGKAGSSSAMPEVKGIDAINFSSIKEGKSESLSSSFNKIAVDVRSGISDNTNSKGSHPQVSYKPEKWMLPQQAEDTLTQLNLAIVGHVDSGKSTLSGRLLHLLGRISQKQMHKFEKEAKIQGKGSFAYAWALDESSEERERGITMTVAVAYFDTKKYHVVVLDSPGHKDFVPNMISGATQADAAILVIDASRGSFEAGMDGGKGQTREHAQLIRSFGVDQVIVAVNKMDTVAYAKDRFDYIRQQLGMFLRTCGFKDSCVSWIPMSAMENQNLVASPSDASFKSWYNGPYLLDAIDSLPPPAREYSKPLLMPICDVIKSPTLGQVSACGKLEAGALRSGSKVLVMPAAVMGTVRSMERDSNACSVARAGDNVSVTLQGVDGSNVIAGGVLCHPDFPVAVSNHLELKVLVLDGASPVLMGSQLEFHIHHAKEPARVSRISSILDPKTGKVTKKSPRCLTAKQSAVIEVTLQEPVCVVDVSICKALGRVSLRSSGRTIAVGLVTRIIEELH